MQLLLNQGLRIHPAAIALLAIMPLLLGCSEEQSSSPQTNENIEQSPPSSFERLNPELHSSVKEIALDYLEQISDDFTQVSIAIEQLQSAIHSFIAEATSENLSLTRQAWLVAHGAYELTTLHRNFASQVLSDAQDLELLQLQYQIDHWPIIPGYIDYVQGYPDSGIVHDINVVLDRETLREQHGAFDVSEVALGFHVMEFLLWGYDTDSGTRPSDDYTAVMELSQEQAESGYSLDQLSNNRRRLLLTVIADTLLEDFGDLQTLWVEQHSQIQQSIESMSGSEVIIMLADSMVAMLTEELLLRSLYPMLNGDFVESIQSPYSLSTQNAVSTQLSGLERLLLEQQTENGTTLDLVFAAVSDDFSEFFYQNFDASKSCLVLLYTNVDSETANASNQNEIEVVECINLLTNMVDHIERLKFELTN